MAAPESQPVGEVGLPDGGHQSNVFPPFDAHNFIPQIVWLVIIFGALYLLMSRLALPRVENILEARRTRINKDLDEARAMQDQAQAAGSAYEKTLADAKGRAQALGQQAHDQLHAESETKRHALEADLAQKLAASETQIAATKAQAMSNVGTIARDAARTVVEHLTGRPASGEAIAAASNAIETN